MALLVIFGAGAARATTIDGDQLDIFLSDTGNVQVQPLNQNSYTFYYPGDEAGDAGFFIGVPATGETFGPGLTAGSTPYVYQAGTSGPVTGLGTAASPLRQITTYNAVEGSTVAEVTQTTTYVNGENSFKQRFEVKNVSGSSLAYRALAAADLYLEGSDDGTGFFTPGPPRMVGGLSEATGRAGGLREVPTSPWSAFQELPYENIWEDTVFAPGGPGFNNSIDSRLLDNAIGVQWDDHYSSGLGNGATASYEIEWQFGLAGLTAAPASALLGTGSFHQVTVTATDANGDLINGGTIR
ncbi:MAG TPA: hypothetical protein VJ989_10280, partial [Solirubrobacterales bacterium]|nr:hypothetical protein [Solirubrobacterales bacterium]